MKIEIIIPNYNGFLLLKKNVPKVLRVISSYKNISLTVIDDASDSEEIKMVEDLIQTINKTQTHISLIKNTKNLGFSSTVNRGGLDSSADLLVLLNSDVAPEEKFLDSVIEHFEKNPQLFGVGCMDKSIEGDKVVLRGRGIGMWRRGLLVHKKGEVDTKSTFWISGGSCVIRKELFKKLGGFDPLYNPFYWEDIDLSYRAQKSGYEILFENKSIVTHEHGEGSVKKHYKKNKIETIAYRNQFTFIWKNITDVTLLVSHIVWMPYHILKALINFNTPFFKGLFLALVRLPAIIKQRKTQKKFYKVSDTNILARFQKES